MKILCDTHSHTIASTHAYSTVHDYIRDARGNGLELFSLTDHGPTMPDAPHPWHFGNMKILPRVVENIAILRAIEANILPEPFTNTHDRYVDLPDGMLGYLDFAIASFHEPVFAPGSVRENTQAMIRAITSGGNSDYWPSRQSQIPRHPRRDRARRQGPQCALGNQQQFFFTVPKRFRTPLPQLVGVD